VSFTDTFRALHRLGTFVMPNPWDRGSARVLQQLGFPALATTSAGFGRSLGKDDYQVTRAELVAHVASLTATLAVPLNVDGERLFPDDGGGITETVRLLAEAGAAGCSVEDYDQSSGAMLPLARATEAVAEAAEACGRHGMVLTARCENLIRGVPDLDDTIRRLAAYRTAGAEVLYAPGVVTATDIARVVAEAGGPVNVLALPDTPPVPELRAIGVRRVSTGSQLYNAAYATLKDRAQALLA
jgi:2-methylisocitrate lyase-like PEP mutase family enzyme